MWSFRKLSYSDDRGNRVRICNPAFLFLHHDMGPVIRRYRDRVRERRRREPHSKRSANGCVVVCWWGVMLVLPMSIMLVISGSMSVMLVPLVLVAYLALGLAVAWRISGEQYADDGVAVLLGSGVCPSCLYRISAKPHEDDLRVICPECAAAWKARNIGTMLNDDHAS